MSNDSKGTRKPKKGTSKDSKTSGRFKLSSELLIAILVASLYAVFLVDTSLDTGLITVMLSAFLFAAFLVFAYIVRAGTHRMKREFSALLYVFLGLSALSFVWKLLLYSNIIDATKTGLAAWIMIVGLVFALVSIIIIAAIAILEKMSPRDIFLAAGDLKVIPFSVIAFILCVILGLGATYFIFGGATLGQDKLTPLVLAILGFSVLCAISEELWFRGLLMSRITPILGQSGGNIYQALVFGVFEAVMFYTLTGQISLMPAIFIIGAMTGYYWGRATLRSNSLISPILLHAGFYVLVMLPIMTGLAA